MIYSILMMCDLQYKLKASLRTGPERRVTEAAPSSLFFIATITIRIRISISITIAITITIRISISISIIVSYHAHTA